jgi:amino acid adenylation domain-containing protein
MTTSETGAAGYPLSPGQRRLFLLGAAAPGFCCQCVAALPGELDPGLVARRLEAAAARHGILRTAFRRRPGMRLPLQVPGAGAAPELRRLDLAALEMSPEAALERLGHAERERAWDLEQGPLLSAVLADLGPGRQALVLTLPALAGDARTLANLLAELVSGTAEEEPVQFVEFSGWHASLATDEGAEEGMERWRRLDLAVPAPGLPWPPSPPSREEPAGAGVGAVAVELEPDATERIAAAAGRCRTPPEAVLLAAWAVLLGRLGGAEEAAIGVVSSGRKLEDFAGSLGPFAGALPLRLSLAAAEPFAEVVRRAATELNAARESEEYFPLAASEPARLGAGFELEDWSAAGQAALLSRHVWSEPFALKLTLREAPAGLSGTLLYDRAAYAEEAVRRLAACFSSLLAGALAAPGTPAGLLPLLAPAVRQRLLVDWNATTRPFPAELGVHQLFAEQAARTPGAPAASFSGRRLTYGELAVHAHQIARRLRREGIGPDGVVAICVLDPLLMLAGLLGILEAGGAYLPLDPTYPARRLAFMLRDSGAALLLCDEATLPDLPAGGPRRLRLDAEARSLAGEASIPVDGGAGPGNLAYVLYTSGSTGQPKGVMIPHRGLVNYVSWAVAAYEVAAGRGAPVHSPIGFDLTVTALFPPLLAGREVLFVPPQQGVEALAGLLAAEEALSLVKLTPSHLVLLGQQLPAGRMGRAARTLVIGGEALAGRDLEPLRSGATVPRVVNEYGPTETVVGCAVFTVDPESPLPAAVPIGRPIANTRIYLLDRGLEPVPEGSAGEIAVGGEGLARGYLGRPDATAERFVPDPFAAAPGGRLYRTGDLARLGSGGDLEFLGRADQQIKVRGFRVELGEIEAALATHPRVAAAAVALREDEPGDRRLVGYAVPAGSPVPTAGELLAHLREGLPEHMIPAAFVILESLPLSVHGKLDRRALPAPDRLRPDLEVGYAPPSTELERAVAAIWRQQLRLDEVGIHDNFFDLGGDSFRMFQVHRAVAAAAGRDFPVLRLFQHPTIHSLSGYLADLLAGGGEAGESVAASQARAETRRSALGGRRQQRGQARAEREEAVE